MDSKEKVLYIASLAAEKKALGVVILDIKKLSSIADYIVICHGTSNRQVQAITESIGQELKKKRIVPIGTEGTSEGRWALLDYEDIIVHIFFEPVRGFYDLDGLWAEAPQLSI